MGFIGSTYYLGNGGLCLFASATTVIATATSVFAFSAWMRASNQGLTLAHLSTKLEPFLTKNTP
jgi:hypothetical protein